MQVINDNILNSFLVLAEILVFSSVLLSSPRSIIIPTPACCGTGVGGALAWPRCGMNLQGEGGQGFQWDMPPDASKLEVPNTASTSRIE